MSLQAAAEPLPDDPDNHRDNEIQVTQIPDSSKVKIYVLDDGKIKFDVLEPVL